MQKLTKDQEKLLAKYSANEMRQLKAIVNKLLLPIGGVEQFELDDYYSIANVELWKAVKNYDVKKCDNFENYYKSNLQRKFKTHLRDIHRDKRCIKRKIKDSNGNEEIIYVKESRLDAPIDEEAKSYLLDIIEGADNVENAFFDNEIFHKAIKNFISSLTKRELEVLKCMVNGVRTIPEISKITGFSVEKTEMYKESILYRKTIMLDGGLKV